MNKTLIFSLCAAALLVTGCASKKDLQNCQNENRELTNNYQDAKEHPVALFRLGNAYYNQKKHEEAAAKKDWEQASLWAEQVWQYQVKAADLGLRAKTYLEQNGAKKVK